MKTALCGAYATAMQAAAHVQLPNSADCHAAVQIVQRLRRHGFEAYLVGGCVRDMVLGREPKDYDVATSARPAEVMRLFSRVIEVGIAFGVVRVRLQSLPGEWSEIEVATFRADGGYSDGRRPDHVRFTHAQEDVVRRDFTLNGLLLDPQLVEDGDVVRAQQGLVIDWVGGLEDLRTGRLRAIGDPLLRFGEDALRLLRAARFAARFDLQVDSETARAVRQQAATLMKVSVERITNEICLMLVAASAETGLRHLADLGLAAVMWPELWAADNQLLFARKRALSLAGSGEERLPPQEGCLLAHGGVGLPLALASLCWPLAGWLGSAEAQRTLRLANADRSAAVGILELAQVALAKGLIAHAPTPPPWPAALSRWLRNPLADQALLLLEAADALATARDWRWARSRWPADQAFPAAALSGSDLKGLGFNPGPRFKLALAAAEDALLEGASADQARATALALVSGAEP